MSELLALLTVYDHPRDFPRHVVVRETRIYRGELEPRACLIACLYDTVEDMRADYGHLFWLERDPADDPVILGCWI